MILRYVTQRHDPEIYNPETWSKEMWSQDAWSRDTVQRRVIYRHDSRGPWSRDTIQRSKLGERKFKETSWTRSNHYRCLIFSNERRRATKPSTCCRVFYFMSVEKLSQIYFLRTVPPWSYLYMGFANSYRTLDDQGRIQGYSALSIIIIRNHFSLSLEMRCRVLLLLCTDCTLSWESHEGQLFINAARF